ncbi:DUF6470 family protein [Oscillospiraceae bacterium OttesenSCG-928-F05]|nr:DUF6470 family protein [Oscillospiraceae bacterium OttesenSCG-928-F05]
MAARVSINQIQGQIGLSVEPGRLEMVRAARMRLVLKQNPTEMEVQREKSRLTIDQTQCFEESGLAKPLKQASNFYKKSYGKGMRGIGKRVSEGRTYLKAGPKAEPAAQIERSKNIKYKGVTSVAMPKSRPKIKFEPGGITINWKMGDVIINWQKESAEMRYVPYKVDVFLRTQPKIEITITHDAEANYRAPSSVAGASIDEAI